MPLPSLSDLSLQTRGYLPLHKRTRARTEEARKAVLQNPDLLSLVLTEALDAPDYASAFEIAKSACAADTALVDACAPLWRALNQRFFADSSITTRPTHRATFLANCARAEAYRKGDLRLKANENDCATFVLAAVRHEHTQIEDASDRLTGDVAFVIKAMQANGQCLEKVSLEMRNTRAVVLAAVVEYGAAIEWAAGELKSDREIVLAAVGNYGPALTMVDQAYRNDAEVVKLAASNYHLALKSATPAVQNDKDVVLAAVRHRGEALEFAGPIPRSDLDVVLEAVLNDTDAYAFALPPARDDARVVRLVRG